MAVADVVDVVNGQPQQARCVLKVLQPVPRRA